MRRLIRETANTGFLGKIRTHPRIISFLSFGLLALLAGSIYWRTLCPGIGYWGDQAKFAFLGKVLGTAHISVYPTYIVLNHIFVSLFPKGTLALKANLLSAFLSIIAIWFLYATLVLLKVRPLIAFFTSLAFSFTYSIWMYSVIAEVYTLNALFVIVVIFLLLVLNRTRLDRYFFLATIVYAFSFGNHLTMIGLLPAFAYAVWVTDRKTFTNPKKIILVLVIIIAGFAQYYYVVWRTNDPTTRFLETDTQSLIRFLTTFHTDEGFTFTLREIVLERIPILAGYILREFSIFILPAIWGMIFLKDRTTNVFLGLCILGETLFSLNVNGRETWAFFIPVYIVLAIYLGLGIEDIFNRFRKYPRLVLASLVLPIFFLGLNFQRMDQSQHVLHARMVEKVLATIPHDSVIIVDEYDSACFFWYYLIGQDFERNSVYAFPYYFAGTDGIKDYLLGKQPFVIYPERKTIQPGLQVYAYWTIADYLKKAGFELQSTGNKYVFLLKLPE
jgi:hypothetical protein